MGLKRSAQLKIFKKYVEQTDHYNPKFCSIALRRTSGACANPLLENPSAITKKKKDIMRGRKDFKYV
jgi:hypothetical protein